MLSGVVDCNSILAGVITHFDNSSNFQLVQSILKKEFAFITSREIMSEVELVLKLESSLQKHLRTLAETDALCEKLRSVARMVEPERVVSHAVSRDVTDTKFLDLAVASDADYFVTNDRRHLLPLKRIGRTRIVTPHKFLALRAAR